MAKIYQNGTWKKRTITALSVALASTLSLGYFTACANEDNSSTNTDDDTTVSATDTQLLKNGNFEFHGEMDKEIKDRRTLINTPNSWSFTSGSPSSTTKSGVIDTSADAWKDMTQTGGYAFGEYTYTGKTTKYKDKKVKTFKDIDDAVAHFKDDNVSAYDRLYFYDVWKNEISSLASDSEAKKMFNEYQYSVDYEDVQYLKADLTEGVTLREGVAEDETNVLMLHNLANTNDVVGTAQNYSSSTTITLQAGTAAKLSLWARTDNLRHYDESEDNDDNPNASGMEVNAKAGAYIGVTNTVGGTTLDQMQIKNINTKGEWEQYSIYVRANTFAATTFTISLGLGQGSSSDRLEHVNGYAFFDDLTCEVIPASGTDSFESVVYDANGNANDGVLACNINSLKADKIFDLDDKNNEAETYALDLYAAFSADDTLLSGATVGLTEEKSGSKTYTTADFGLGDDAQNFAKLTTLSNIASSSNKQLSAIYEKDFKDKYPFGTDGDVLMLMSYNGAAYTATLPSVTLQPNERQLVSFFVKTNEIPSGYSGASATVVETNAGAVINKTSISAFDSTTVKTIDIDANVAEKTDILKGWAQCFFFIANTDKNNAHDFYITLSYGPTTIVGTNKTNYCDGYAAFTNFETRTLTKTEYSYATTGDQAVSVSLTGESQATKSFDTVSATAQKDIETGLALPANFSGVLGGSNFVNKDGVDNVLPEGVYTGLLNSKYAENYFTAKDEWTKNLKDGANANEWWSNYFGNARQPLAIINNEAAAYGYLSETLTVSASSMQEISLRVKVSNGAKANVYLTDASSADKTGELLTPTAPTYTYWYDDNGNICRIDPTDDHFDKREDVLYTLQDNGLYRKNGGDDTYYANFTGYEKDEDGNLVTSKGVTAFYNKDGKYFAYYNENTKEYSTEVIQLPTTEGEESILRYEYSAETLKGYGTHIAIDNTDGALTDWVTVSFYVSTGDEAKTYRLEVWSGNREGTQKNPANSYVIFDSYANEDASGDYANLLNETVSALKLKNNVGDHDKLSENVVYYTFTFYDSDAYLRYDATKDENNEGNPYNSYKQSTYSEQISYLYVDDKNGEVLNAGSRYAMFLDYTATDTEVVPDETEDTDDTTADSATTTDPMNIFLLISSGLLAVILLVVIVLVVVRRIAKNHPKKVKIKGSKKDNRYRPSQDEE